MSHHLKQILCWNGHKANRRKWMSTSCIPGMYSSNNGVNESDWTLTFIGACNPLQWCDIVVVLTHWKGENSNLGRKRKTWTNPHSGRSRAEWVEEATRGKPPFCWASCIAWRHPVLCPLLHPWTAWLFYCSVLEGHSSSGGRQRRKSSCFQPKQIKRPHSKANETSTYIQQLVEGKVKARLVVGGAFSLHLLHSVLEDLLVAHVCLNEMLEAGDHRLGLLVKLQRGQGCKHELRHKQSH